jgi:pilus assembly protein Flp/PilA
MKQIRKVLGDTTGATSIEYAAIASLISVVAIGAIATIGTSVNALFQTVPGF